MSALLCCFNYNLSDRWYLPGILLDLQRAISFCKKKKLDYVVVSDIVIPSSPKERQVICKNMDNTSIHLFLQQLIDSNKYIYFKTPIDGCISINQSFLVIVENFVSRPDSGFLYFSGHGDTRPINPLMGSMVHCLLLPDNNYLPISILHDVLKVKEDLLILLDCCNVSSVNWDCNHTVITPSRLINYTSYTGSYFSQEFFDDIEHKSIQDIIGNSKGALEVKGTGSKLIK